MIEQLDFFDEETRVFKDRIFDFWLEWEIKRSLRYQNFISLIVLEPDSPVTNIKTLRDLVKVIKKNVRDTDIIGRLNGQKFGVILLMSDLDGAFIMARRLSEHVDNYIFEEEPHNKVTLSIGGSCFPTNGIEKNILVEKAELMLIEAKKNGRKIVFSNIL